jgi:hypothetical protein
VHFFRKVWWRGRCLLYAFTIFSSDDFNYHGKALPKEAQIDTGAIDENETLEDRVAKELAK